MKHSGCLPEPLLHLTVLYLVYFVELLNALSYLFPLWVLIAQLGEGVCDNPATSDGALRAHHFRVSVPPRHAMSPIGELSKRVSQAKCGALVRASYLIFFPRRDCIVFWLVDEIWWLVQLVDVNFGNPVGLDANRAFCWGYEGYWPSWRIISSGWDTGQCIVYCMWMKG